MFVLARSIERLTDTTVVYPGTNIRTQLADASNLCYPYIQFSVHRGACGRARASSLSKIDCKIRIPELRVHTTIQSRTELNNYAVSIHLRTTRI